jgi:hypothetical protein
MKLEREALEFQVTHFRSEVQAKTDELSQISAQIQEVRRTIDK